MGYCWLCTLLFKLLPSAGLVAQAQLEHTCTAALEELREGVERASACEMWVRRGETEEKG